MTLKVTGLWGISNAAKAIDIVSKAGIDIAGVPGVAWHGEDDDYVKFKAAPGTWKFLGLVTLPLTSPKPLPLPLRTTGVLTMGLIFPTQSQCCWSLIKKMMFGLLWGPFVTDDFEANGLCYPLSFLDSRCIRRIAINLETFFTQPVRLNYQDISDSMLEKRLNPDVSG